MKLKTIDELDNIIWVNGEAYNTLKQEAIKWIKDIQNNRAPEIKKTKNKHTLYSLHRLYGGSDILKIFFNITQEDLE